MKKITIIEIMNQLKSWLLSPLKTDKPTVNLTEEKERSNIKEKVDISKDVKRWKEPSENATHISGGHCGVLPRCPLQDCSTYSRIVGRLVADGSQLCLSPGIGFGQVDYLAVTIQRMWPNVYWGQLTSQNWLLKRHKIPAFLTHFGAVPKG